MSSYCLLQHANCFTLHAWHDGWRVVAVSRPPCESLHHLPLESGRRFIHVDRSRPAECHSQASSHSHDAGLVRRGSEAVRRDFTRCNLSCVCRVIGAYLGTFRVMPTDYGDILHQLASGSDEHKGLLVKRSRGEKLFLPLQLQQHIILGAPREAYRTRYPLAGYTVPPDANETRYNGEYREFQPKPPGPLAQ